MGLGHGELGLAAWVPRTDGLLECGLSPARRRARSARRPASGLTDGLAIAVETHLQRYWYSRSRVPGPSATKRYSCHRLSVLDAQARPAPGKHLPGRYFRPRT